MQEKHFLLSTIWCLTLLIARVSGAGEARSLLKATEQKVAVARSEDSRVQIGNIKVDVFANTEWEQENAGSLSLKQGVIRLRSGSQESFRVMTPVGTINVHSSSRDKNEESNKDAGDPREEGALGLDVIVQYMVEKATAQVEVLSGSAFIQGTFRDEILNIQRNERGAFVGVPEVDGPAFDVLLKGRKAVRGGLSGPESLSSAAREELRKKYEPNLRPVQKVVVIKAKPGQICSAPFAKFNECVWRCQSKNGAGASGGGGGACGECVRERCLANGQWGDRTVLRGEARRACGRGQKPVALCDY